MGLRGRTPYAVSTRSEKRLIAPSKILRELCTHYTIFKTPFYKLFREQWGYPLDPKNINQDTDCTLVHKRIFGIEV